MICSIIKSKTQDVKFYRMDYIEKNWGLSQNNFIIALRKRFNLV